MSLLSRLPPWTERAVLPALVLLVHTFTIGRWAMWDAELWTMETSIRPFGAMIHAVVGDRHPPLYFAITWLFAHVWSTDFMIRLPSVLAAAAATAVVHDVGGRHFGSWAGRGAALVMATHPFVAAYADTARSGTLTIALGAVALGAALDLARGERGALRLGLALSAGVLVHYGFVLACGMAAAAVLVARRWDRATLAALAAPAVALAPWAAFAHGQQALERTAVPRSTSVLRYLWWPVGPNYVFHGATLAVVAAIAGVIVARRAPLAAAALAAVALPLAVSDQPESLGKYYVFASAFPLFALALGAGVGALPGRARVVAIAAWLLAVGFGWRDVYALQSSPVSVVVGDPLTHDVRVEADLLRNLGAPSYARASRAASVIGWYAPDLPWANPPRPESWRIERVDAEPEGCALGDAFAGKLVIPDVRDCRVAKGRVAEAARSTPYTPFLLEASAYAESRGDRDEALALAVRAAQDPIAWKADVRAARLRLARGDHEGALQDLRRAEAKAARYRLVPAWTELLDLEAKLGPEAAASANATRRCLDEYGHWLVIPVCAGGWLAAL